MGTGVGGWVEDWSRFGPVRLHFDARGTISNLRVVSEEDSVAGATGWTGPLEE